LKKLDVVVSLTLFDELDEEQSVLAVTENGFGKRSPVTEYRLQSRAGTGIKNMAWNPELGEVVTVQVLKNADEVIVVTKSGYTIRFSASDIRTMGRVTKGVKAIDLEENDKVASVERIVSQETVEEASE